MKVSIYIRNKNYGPSCRYRIYQYIEYFYTKLDVNIYQYNDDKIYIKMRNSNKNKLINSFIKINAYIAGCINRYKSICNDLNNEMPETIFIQREMFPKYIPKLMKNIFLKYISNCKNLVWDIDDNILEGKEISKLEFDLLSKYSKTIIVSTNFLKEKISLQYRHKVKVIPTTDCNIQEINLSKININRLKMLNEELTLVWIGTKSNIKFLYDIIQELDIAAKYLKERNIKLRLKIISSIALNEYTNDLDIENIEWSKETAFNEMKMSHIGLMPLEENEYTLGKAGFKAVQYIGMGIPAIVSNVGFNKEVIENGKNGYLINSKSGWSEAIIKIALNIDEWKSMSIYSREIWEKHFNSKQISREILELL